MAQTALILGASGGVGGATARALLRRGWQIRGLVRRRRPGLDAAIQWLEGDCLDRDSVAGAAKGVQAIVHAVNPPGYRQWGEVVLPMLDNSIAAACREDARLVLPGTIYNYDPAMTPVARPGMPEQPGTRKGLIRREMEARMAASNARTLVLRAGDFYGPHARNSWLSDGIIKPGKPVPRRVFYPGQAGVGHSWAYLPDVGETFARLLDQEERLSPHARFHLAGFWDADGVQFLSALGQAAGHDVKPRALPWRLLPLIAPFNETMREMIEMRVYWMHPVRLDNEALVRFLGDEPRTPVVASLRTTLASFGCLASDDDRSTQAAQSA
jgi:nucleoside-diphosphate-sugar epimerase